MNKRLIIVLICVLALAAVAAYFLFRPIPFTVGFQVASINYPMMYTIQGKFFENEGLTPKVQQFNSADDARDSLLGGSVFIDSVIPIQDMAKIEQQRPGTLGIAALLLSDKEHPLDYLVVPSNSGIKSAQELAGKTIVVFTGTYSETLTRLTFSKLGITNINFLKLPPGDMQKALETGRADAGILYDPIATKAEVEGWGKIIEKGFWESYLIPVIVVGAYAYNIQAVQNNPNTGRRVFTALENAINSAKQDSSKAKSSIRPYFPNISDDVIKRLPDARVELADKVDPTLIDKTLELYAANGIIPKTVDLRGLLRKP